MTLPPWLDFSGEPQKTEAEIRAEAPTFARIIQRARDRAKASQGKLSETAYTDLLDRVSGGRS